MQALSLLLDTYSLLCLYCLKLCMAQKYFLRKLNEVSNIIMSLLQMIKLSLR
jgi:hypothetical protein